MQAFFITLFQTVSMELLSILGIFFLLGYILSKLQQATHRQYMRTIGWRGILLTAWIGTPIHELGHIFFIKVFHHKLGKISFFHPNRITGELGHVNHSYNKRSIYQQIGNFFIGAAPMIFGSLILVILLYILVPNATDIFQPLATGNTTLSFSSLTTIKNIILNLFAKEHIHTISFWIFLFLSFCISAHIAPSKQDRRSMWHGFFWMVLILTILNIIPLLLGVETLKYFSIMFHYTAIIAAIFLYTLIISILHYIASWIVLMIPYHIFHIIKK